MESSLWAANADSEALLALHSCKPLTVNLRGIANSVFAKATLLGAFLWVHI